MPNTFIYGLIDPRNDQVRYVGKSNNPQVRLLRHIKDAKAGGTCHRLSWIRGLLNLNLLPLLTVLEEVDVSVWGEREEYWIGKFDNLTNMIDGGKFCPMSVDSIVKKMKETKRLNPQKFSIETRRKLSDRTKSLWDLGIKKPRVQSVSERNTRKKSMVDVWAVRPETKRNEIGSRISLRKNKAVIQYDERMNMVSEFKSVMQAEKDFGVTKSKISKACKSGLLYKGFYWAYKNTTDGVL
jgi:group I intron endonuclease